MYHFVDTTLLSRSAPKLMTLFESCATGHFDWMPSFFLLSPILEVRFLLTARKHKAAKQRTRVKGLPLFEIRVDGSCVCVCKMAGGRSQ